MSNLLPAIAPLTLTTGERITVRALTAFEILAKAQFLIDHLKSVEGDIDVIKLLMQVGTTHADQLADLIAISCTKDQAWAKQLGLPDLLAIAAEVIAVNTAAQKKTPELLMQLLGRLSS